MYDLRGAARPARAFYQDPNATPVAPAINYLETHRGRLWEIDDGKELLKTMKEFAASSVKLLARTLDAIATLREMVDYDSADHLVTLSSCLLLCSSWSSIVCRVRSTS